MAAFSLYFNLATTAVNNGKFDSDKAHFVGSLLTADIFWLIMIFSYLVLAYINKEKGLKLFLLILGVVFTLFWLWSALPPFINSLAP